MSNDKEIAAGASPDRKPGEGSSLVSTNETIRPRRQGSTDDWVYELRRVLFEVLEPQRQALAKAGEAEVLTRGWQDLQPLVAELTTFLQDLKTDVANIMDDRHKNRIEVEGVGLVRRERRKVRKNWQSKALIQRIVLIALDDADAIDMETGEVLRPEMLLMAQKITEVLALTLGLTGSTSWKVGTWNPDTKSFDGGLRQLGLEPDDWCDEQDLGPTVSIPRKPLVPKFEYDEPTKPQESDDR